MSAVYDSQGFKITQEQFDTYIRSLGRLGEEAERLRQELSLTEEGLTNYAQEVEQLRKANEKLQTLVIWSVDTMSALHRSIEPMEDDPELAGRVPPAAMRAFVDALADIDRERFGLHPSDNCPDK